RQVGGKSHSIVVLDDDATTARNLRKRLDEEGGRYAAKIVRDQLAVQLLLKRSRPHALIMPMDSEAERKFAQSVHKHLSAAGEEATLWIGLHRDGQEEPAGQWA